MRPLEFRADALELGSDKLQSSGEVDDAEYSKRTQVQRDEHFAEKLKFWKQKCQGDRRHGNMVNLVNFERNNTPRNYQPHHKGFGHIRAVSPPIVGDTNNVASSHRQSRNPLDRPLHQRQVFSYLDGVQNLSINEESDVRSPSVLSFETLDWLVTRPSDTRQSSGPAGDSEYARRIQEQEDEEFARMLQFSSIDGTTTNVAGSHVHRQHSLIRPLQQRQGEESEFAFLNSNSYGSDEEIVFGMDRNDISLLPVHRYKRPTSRKSEDNKTCLVCLNEFKKGERLRTLPCCHMYHVDCIDEWLTRNAKCPVCRLSAEQRH